MTARASLGFPLSAHPHIPIPIRGICICHDQVRDGIMVRRWDPQWEFFVVGVLQLTWRKP